jgi:hypothetical protein
MHRITRRQSPSQPSTRRRRALLGAAVGCVAAIAAAGPAAADVIFDLSPPFAGTTRYYQIIKAKHSGLNLNVPEASTKNGTQIIQWDGSTFMNGQWEFVAKDNGMSIRNRWSRQCLDVTSTAAGTPVVQRPCDGTVSQRWTYNTAQQAGDPVYRNFKNSWSGLDLNVEGGSKEYGAKLIQWPHVQGAPNAMFGHFFGIEPTVD